eukprot:353517-Chlamydomonas_euryale.AAC.4
MELGNLEETRDAFHDAKTKESQQEEGEEVTLVVNATGGPHKMSFKVRLTNAAGLRVLQRTKGQRQETPPLPHGVLAHSHAHTMTLWSQPQQRFIRGRLTALCVYVVVALLALCHMRAYAQPDGG